MHHVSSVDAVGLTRFDIGMTGVTFVAAVACVLEQGGVKGCEEVKESKSGAWLCVV